MRFTDNPFELLMKQKPRPGREEIPQPPEGSPCRQCSFWRGMVCVGLCYREFMAKVEKDTSGQPGPKSREE